jgi:glutathione synthase/RimK-type ligase-like ATP-grasp enzyme
VIDDPQSIIRCGNKVFLAGALEQAKLRRRARWWATAST